MNNPPDPKSPPDRFHPLAPVAVQMIVLEPGGTLYDDTAWPRWLMRVLQQIGVRAEFRPLIRLFEHEWLGAVYRGECDYWSALSGFLKQLGLSSAQIEEIEAAGRSKWHARETDFRLFPGVAAALSQLRSVGFSLGLVANSTRTPDQFERRLRLLGVREHFELVATSRELGRALPDRRVFDESAEMARCSSSEMVFVSDDLAQLDAAAEAGWRTAGMHFDAACREHLELERLIDLTSAFAPKLAASDRWLRAA